MTGDLQKMVDTLTLAVLTYPNDQNYWIDLGIAQQTIGQFEPALASHKKSLALNPDSAIAHVNVLDCLLALSSNSASPRRN